MIALPITRILVAAASLCLTLPLTAPAAIDFIARAASLSAAFLVVAFLLFGVAASAHVLRR